MTDQPRPAAAATAWAWRRLTFETLLSALNSIGTLWIFVLMVVINIDVIGRTAFNSPLPGVLELVRLSIVGIVFIQLGHTLRAGRMTRTESLMRRLRQRAPRVSFALEACYGVAGAMLFAVLFQASYPFFLRSFASGEYAGVEGYVTYPVWPVRLIILIGCACSGIQYLLFAWRDLMIALHGEAPPPTVEDIGEAESAAYGSGD